MKSQNGFTLIEIIVVIAIMALLAGALIPSGMQTLDIERQKKSEAVMDDLAVAIRAYYEDNGAFPTSLNGAANSLSHPPGGRSAYIFASDPNKIYQDKWGVNLQLLASTPANVYRRDVVSGGPDGAIQGTNDVRKTVDVIDIRRKVVKSQIDNANTVLAGLNSILNSYRNRNPFPATWTVLSGPAVTWPTIRTQLVNRGYLPNTTTLNDPFGNQYIYNNAQGVLTINTAAASYPKYP